MDSKAKRSTYILVDQLQKCEPVQGAKIKYGGNITTITMAGAWRDSRNSEGESRRG